MVFSFLSFSRLMVFHLFPLASVAVSQEASTEADVMSKTGGILKHIAGIIGARGRGKI